MRTHEILNKAADLVEQGWCQGTNRRWGDKDEQYFCTVGALGVACNLSCGELTYKYPEYLAAKGFVQSVIGTPHVAGWNDAPQRTQAEVIATLRMAAWLADPKRPAGPGGR